MMKDKASFVVPVYGKEIMVQHRPDRTWGLFGGRQRAKESPTQCAVREFTEETGTRPRGQLKHLLSSRNYTVYSLQVPNKLKRISKCNETIGFKWLEPNRLKSLNLIKEFRSYINPFINKVEAKMVKSLNVSTGEAIEILSTLKAEGRTDLAREFGQELFGGNKKNKTTAQAENEATLDGESIKILNEKATAIMEECLRMVEKRAEGPVEADILTKHLIKMMNEKLGVPVEDDVEDTDELVDEEDTDTDVDTDVDTEDTGEEEDTEDTEETDDEINTDE